MVLIMPSHMSEERKAAMAAYGAELVMVSQDEGMEGARDLADQMVADGKGVVLDQFANQDNPLAHYEGTGPEILRQTGGEITHFVSSMGTTGTIMGVSRFFREHKPDIEIVALHPIEGSAIPGIRRWPEAYLPRIYDAAQVDRIIDIEQSLAEETMRQLAKEEGIFCEPASAASIAGLLKLNDEIPKNSTIVCVLTGNGLKDPDCAIKNNDAIFRKNIEPSLKNITKILGY